MKRDMDLIRSLLLYSEENCKPLHGVYFKFSEYCWEGDIEELKRHIYLLEGEALLEEGLPSSEDDIGLGNLTWAGYNFLDSVRDPKIWRETQDIAKNAGGFTFELLAEIAKGLIKTKIMKHTGVELQS